MILPPKSPRKYFFLFRVESSNNISTLKTLATRLLRQKLKLIISSYFGFAKSNKTADFLKSKQKLLQSLLLQTLSWHAKHHSPCVWVSTSLYCKVPRHSFNNSALLNAFSPVSFKNLIINPQNQYSRGDLCKEMVCSIFLVRH